MFSGEDKLLCTEQEQEQEKRREGEKPRNKKNAWAHMPKSKHCDNTKSARTRTLRNPAINPKLSSRALLDFKAKHKRT